MHFKSAVIFCALYFITSVWSIGLNKDQLNIFLPMEQDYKHIEIPYIMFFEFGIENPKNSLLEINHNRDEEPHLKIKRSVLASAYEDKTFDTYEVPMLTSFQVEYYLNAFYVRVDYYHTHGYLGKGQPNYVITYLFERLLIEGDRLARAENLCNHIITTVEFLLIMLELRPEGNGLNQSQIEEFVRLYRSDRNNSHCIDDARIQNMFQYIRPAANVSMDETASTQNVSKQKFDMTLESRLMFRQFKSNRPAAKVLMELMFLAAQCSTTVHESEDKALSTKEVRSLLSEFTTLDTDKNGVLSKNESEKFLKDYHAENPDVSTFNFDDNEINIAEYMLFNLNKKMEESGFFSII